MTKHRITGHVGNLTERFWVDNNGIVRSNPAHIPIGFGDQVEHEHGVLTQLVKRSNRITIALMLNVDEELEDYDDHVDIRQRALIDTKTFLVRVGAHVELGASILVAARADLTPSAVQQVAREACVRHGVDPDCVTVYTINIPSDPLDIDIRPAPRHPKPDPLLPRQVLTFLALPELADRYQHLVDDGEIPAGLEFVPILHAAINWAARDPQLRDAWVLGNLDAVLAMGAWMLAGPDTELPVHPEGVYEHFTYRAPNWPSI